MTLRTYYQEDCDVSVLKGHKVAIIGYGSQGHVHALSLRNSGVDACVGPYEDFKSREKAGRQGLTVKTDVEAARWADIIMILINDELQADMYRKDIESNLNEGDVFMFAHGFNIHSGLTMPPKLVDVTMIAPKTPGHTIRSGFLDGKDVPMLITVEQDATGKALEKVLAYGVATGNVRAGLLETIYCTETETDLFDEQAVLCGGVYALMQAGSDTLIRVGCDPRSAYFERIHEMKLIVDLIYQSGFEGMRYSISSTAKLGDYVSGPKLITDKARKAMKKILSDIQDGTFANQFPLDTSPAGCQAHFKATHRRASEHLSESVDKEIRKLCSWNNEDSGLISN